MGVVYEAEQESLGRHVALKALPAACEASPTRLQRFLREAQTAARLHHTNIVPVFGVGCQDGVHYYVMQFIAGQGLDRVIEALGNKEGIGDWGLGIGEADAVHSPIPNPQSPIPPSPSPIPNPQSPIPSFRSSATFSAAAAAQMLLAGSSPLESPSGGSAAAQAETAATPPATSAGPKPPVGDRFWRSVAKVGVQVADALQYAHQQGTLHRDIKPGNLLMDSRGTVWIADFGLAKLADLEDLTHSGDIVGTLRYMAPEQFEGKADARSDVYNLGLTLYELLTLRPAFDQRDRRRLIRQMTQEEPPRPRKLNPAIPLDLETIVVKAMASDPGHRYQTAGELAADLRCFLEDRPIRARRVGPLGRLSRWRRRNPAVAALSGTALLLLVAVALVASIGYFHAERERQRTMEEQKRAETNLRLATRAFEDIFDKVASASPARPLVVADQDESPEDDADAPVWPEPTWQNVVTGKDALLLESMLKFYNQFAEENQANVRLQKETARACRRVGDIQRRLGQYDKAETAYRRALATYDALAKASPDSADLLAAIAAVDNGLGIVYRDTGRSAEARDAHDRARQTLLKEPVQAAALPETRFELAKTYSYLRRLSHRGGLPGAEQTGGRRGSRRGEAAENNRKAVDLLGGLLKEAPDNATYQLAMARCLRDESMILAFSRHRDEADQARRRDEAVQARKKAAEMLESLVAAAPRIPTTATNWRRPMSCPRPVRRGRRRPTRAHRNSPAPWRSARTWPPIIPRCRSTGRYWPAATSGSAASPAPPASCPKRPTISPRSSS